MGKQLHKTINALLIFQAAHELGLSLKMIDEITDHMMEKEPNLKELLTNLSNWRNGTLTEYVEFFPVTFKPENKLMNEAPRNLLSNPEELVRILDIIIDSLRMRSLNSQLRLRKSPPTNNS